MSHLLFLTESGQTTAGHASRARDQAVVSVNPRMRGDVMAALHPIRVECPDGLRRVAIGSPAVCLEWSTGRGAGGGRERGRNR
jgi:hypothetical protein